MNNIRHLILYDIIKLLHEHGVKEYSAFIDIENLISIVYEDLCTLYTKDGSMKNIEEGYFAHLGFKAIFHYRIANILTSLESKSEQEKIFLQCKAREISESAKIKTGVEIHPSAKIGKRFIVDHAIGTIIGETTVIGDDCYLLQNVILGARGIANNSKGRRHPKLGNRVEVGANVRIFGPITIGDDVFISPDTIVTRDIPSSSRLVSSSSTSFTNLRKRALS